MPPRSNRIIATRLMLFAELRRPVQDDGDGRIDQPAGTVNQKTLAVIADREELPPCRREVDFEKWLGKSSFPSAGAHGSKDLVRTKMRTWSQRHLKLRRTYSTHGRKMPKFSGDLLFLPLECSLAQFAVIAGAFHGIATHFSTVAHGFVLHWKGELNDVSFHRSRHG